MKGFVIDANIIFTALISGKDIYTQLFAENQLYMPDFALTEIQYYQDLILQKTKVNPNNFRQFVLSLFTNVTIVPNFLISTESYYKAFTLCKDIDEKDTTYLALAIEFDMTLVTKDEVLAKGLKEKGFMNVITLRELFERIAKR